MTLGLQFVSFIYLFIYPPVYLRLSDDSPNVSKGPVHKLSPSHPSEPVTRFVRQFRRQLRAALHHGSSIIQLQDWFV